MTSELAFESELIEHLCHIGGTKQWQYEPGIKNTDQLWANFKHILEQNNPHLSQPLSALEFAQVKAEITKLKTPYEAGRFIYGLNGVTQVEVNLDNGEHVYLTVFDQDEVGAGNTRYQIVNQIERPAVLAGRHDRRFDTTLLINGLPIIQIEEKKAAHDAREALNQMQQYIDEQQYTGIFATLQILIGMTPNNIRYMANTPADKFNTAFAFQWQREADSTNVRDWREFANLMLSIPMAHQMATNYIILDGTRNKQAIKVMRPYQVYATRNIIRKLRGFQFGLDPQEAGYIWHTTGSGKTISSFKAAWLASRLPNVDKVVFMVDRVALTNQTAANYAAYDPGTNDMNKDGVVSDTANISVLRKKLREPGGIIVTSIQKLDRLTQRASFKAPDKHIVFIVDEAHRSTAGEMLQRIKKAFPKSAWFGYTGTPSFDGITTEQLFGKPLHIYTIREAIADRNVLGFKVDFDTTLSDKALKDQYLPEFYRASHPDWTAADIRNKINGMTAEDMDDAVLPSVYDMNAQHVELVVKNIFEKWRNRSDDYRYAALLTTHVGGGKASTPMAMMYYREFKKQNVSQKHPLKVAITFSQSTNNQDEQLAANRSLREAIEDYNQLFNEHFDDTTVKEYTENVVSRLNRTIDDGNYLDLVIVIDQLLTGFDAPQLNTLYVDRTLQGANLIQAYSRTNRIENMTHKPYGRIVNYRWPVHSKQLMNDALQVYANRGSANLQLDLVGDGDEPGVLAPDFEDLIKNARGVVNDLRNTTRNFTDLPASESKQEDMYNLLKRYNGLINQLKQDQHYDYDHPETLLNQIGLTSDQEQVLTGSLANDLKERIAQRRGVDFSDLTLEMQHVEEVQVNYDYLDELIAQLANQVHTGDHDAADATVAEVNKAADQLEDRKYAKQVKQTASDIRSGETTAGSYPMQANQSRALVAGNAQRTRRRAISQFRTKWGLLDINVEAMDAMLSRHAKNADDLDIDNTLTNLINKGQAHYRDDAADEQVQALTKIKYRAEVREAIKRFADSLIDNY
ncbi:type I restriction endonuclease subunit R [Lacticaseibacillus nasuensis]|uniref:Type I restriction enzyme endonuclease subunit n=1 Tax=Lacticaseibacillus nasuensis JCM 17158 TaxID=1291734 RepID=A0A0R1JN58_9LACO|nr:HsdR family type I site-specific deoxyribonuclease [Lacticaseibacillus nasuensis]KRK72896.1 type i site-specific deoxyribonuclease, hsdr family protein [Lacticaseibacillus nasuensis JCM 17158]